MIFAKLLLICYIIQWEVREPDDPGKYLLAIWTPGRSKIIYLQYPLSRYEYRLVVKLLSISYGIINWEVLRYSLVSLVFSDLFAKYLKYVHQARQQIPYSHRKESAALRAVASSVMRRNV